MRRNKNVRQLMHDCASWNQHYPIGTTVKYFPVAGVDNFELHTTRTEAYVLAGDISVIMLNGISGFVVLDQCEPVEVQADRSA